MEVSHLIYWLILREIPKRKTSDKSNSDTRDKIQPQRTQIHQANIEPHIYSHYIFSSHRLVSSPSVFFGGESGPARPLHLEGKMLPPFLKAHKTPQEFTGFSFYNDISQHLPTSVQKKLAPPKKSSSISSLRDVSQHLPTEVQKRSPRPKNLLPLKL